MENLNQLKGKRTVLKSAMTKFKKAFQEIKVLANVDKDSVVIFESKLAKVRNILEEFQEVQLAIEQQGTEFVEDTKERDDFENNYHCSVPLAKGFVESFMKAHVSTEGSAASLEPYRSGQQVPVRLPYLDLPRFDGKFENWMAFQNAFESLVHENDSLSDVNRLQFLISCVSNEAEEIINSLKITAANYQIAWDLLKDRYNNKRGLINTHIAAIYDLPVLSKQAHVDLRRLTDTVEKNIRCLKNLGQNYEQCDVLLIFILSGKLDFKTRNDWEEHCGNELPTLKDFLAFIRQKCITLENLRSNSVLTNMSSKSYNGHSSGNNNQIQASAAGKPVPNNCAVCKGNHKIYTCPKFLEKDIQERIKIVGKLKLCYKCLKGNHAVAQCKLSNCRLCQRTHNMLLHIGDSNTGATANHSSANMSTNVVPQADGNQVSSGVGASDTEVLLSTAVVRLISKWRETIEARVLLDSGSQSHFISRSLCDRLGADQTFNQIKLYGVNGASSEVQYTTSVRIMSRYNTYNCNIKCLVVPKVTGNLPSVSFASDRIKIPSTINLADTQFYMSSEIDLLLGAEIFYELICDGRYNLGPNMPSLQNTVLGYVFGGTLATKSSKSPLSNHCIVHSANDNEIECSLAKLWEDEVMPVKKFLSQEESFCEEHFQRTVQRNLQGRFVVTIPVKNNLNKLGESRSFALKRFFNLERKLSKNNDLKGQYTQFMREYLDLGHMRKIDENKHRHSLSYYIPHHPVLNNNSSTTKLRVVFDASMRTNTGLSLNEVQMVGPTIQPELFELLTRFRQHKIVLTADIAKMYRQVEIVKNQQSLQRIFWREDSSKPLECFELSTITYGFSAAPFMAIRCLYQLGLDFLQKYPKTADVIKSNFYVDDLLTGSESENEAIILRIELTKILATAGFQLRKWNSNNSRVIPTEDAQVRQPIGDTSIKTLGVWWNSYTDTIQYTCDVQSSQVITKRQILSVTAKIFDPFGFISPVLIKAKFILQRFWQLKILWDEPICDYQLKAEWVEFLRDLPLIRGIEVPRRALSGNGNLTEFHGFCDASERGYGACIYFRSFDATTSRWTSRLVCAKTKVCPLKVINLPRLELNSALLLSRLVNKVRSSLIESTVIRSETFWSDSTVALGWIRSSPHKWKTYIANRVSEIQINTKIENWRHVRSENNPADLITRGTSVKTLKDSSLWWDGPSWLTQEVSHWPRSVEAKCLNQADILMEMRPSKIVVAAVSHDWSLFEQFSSMSRLVRVTAFCLRFIENTRSSTDSRKGGNLSLKELQTATNKLIQIVQAAEFTIEIAQLKKSGKVDNKSKLGPLAPFICPDGIMRVGGRMQKTKFHYGKRHPILLPQKHRLTVLITEQTHIKNLHCGPQALLALLREAYWPVGGRYVAKQVVRRCVKCYRTNPIAQIPITGQLPESRVTQSPPFFITGIDYAGPFLIKDKKSRGNRSVKAYVCLFVCFAVKAVHLELVNDLTTESFLAALRRFIARRGKPSQIHSDNATNFVGARNEFKRFLNTSSEQVANELRENGIEWNFIPPKSPHFGGIWEAGIKSVKSHLLRILSNANLVYEELYTVLVQIEAVLNSRPLCPLSNDPNDMSALTPAHFLIGRTLTGAPDLDVTEVQSSRLSRFQRVQQLQQHFWARWSREYVNTLQRRPKVRARAGLATALEVGTMVIVREDGLPPLMWPLGRIVDVFPGMDGEVRVVNVRTKKGVFRREVRKICVLPIGHE